YSIHISCTTHKTFTFPYTTLFRSPWACGNRVGDIACGMDQCAPSGCCALAAQSFPAVRHHGTALRDDRTFQCCHGSGCLVARRGDRKSTRLNSSHVKISYAVFCLE